VRRLQPLTRSNNGVSLLSFTEDYAGAAETYLSQRGFDSIEEAVAAHVETQAQLVSGLTEEQRAQLDELLKQFLAGLEQE